MGNSSIIIKVFILPIVALSFGIVSCSIKAPQKDGKEQKNIFEENTILRQMNIWDSFLPGQNNSSAAEKDALISIGKEAFDDLESDDETQLWSPSRHRVKR